MNDKVKESLYLELPHLWLWCGVFFALGIGIYFALPCEPDIWLSVLCAFMSGVLLFLGRKEYFSRLILSYLFFCALGFCVVTAKAYLIAAPVLGDPLFDTEISGTVVKVEPRNDGQRITLGDLQIGALKPYETPHLVRVNFKEQYPMLKVGDEISGYAHLYAPMLPVQIGAYNFAREAWFKRLGATGRLTLLEEYHPKQARGIDQKLQRLRQSIMLRVMEVLPPESAAVAIPLIVGEQGTVTEEIYDLYRQSGIVHVLSVSGFHLTLLAGLVFFLIRGLLSLFPILDGRVNTKKIAAFLSLLVVGFYLLISGMQVPAVRSFFMVAFVLVAVLFDRQSISLRTTMMAGILILFLWPETLIGVSFQLSFMAVFALVSLYDVLMRRLTISHWRRYWIYKVWLLVLGTVMVSLLASIATAPYSIYHFNQYALYSILGNLMTSVLFSFVIMPLLLAAVLLMPFGWDAPFLKLSGWFFEIIEKMCRWITSLPYADLTVPGFDDWGLWVMTFGFLVLFLCVTKIRWIGVAIVCLGIFSFYTMDKPDVLVSEGGRAIAVRKNDGTLMVSNLTQSKLVTDTWLRRNGQNPKRYNARALFYKNAWHTKGKKIAFSPLNCANADLTIMAKYGFGDCLGDVVERSDLWKNKTHEVYIHGDTIEVKNVRESLGKRFWNKTFFVETPEKTNYNEGDDL